MKAIVLAGGNKGFEAITGDKPKTLAWLLGKRIVEYSLDALVSAGVREIILVLSGDPGKALEELRDKYREYLAKIVFQEEPGILNALKKGLAAAGSGDPLIIAYGDVVSEPDMISSALSAYASSSAEGLALLTPVAAGLNTYGLVAVEDGRIVGIREKPLHEVESTYAFGGIMVLSRSLANTVFSSVSMEDALEKLFSEGILEPFIWSRDWFDIDTPWDLLRAVVGMLSHSSGTLIHNTARISESATLEGPVIIDREAYVDAGAVIKGPAYIGPQSFIGAHSFVRPYTDAERGVIIGAYSEVKRTIIQPNSYIGSHCYITDTVIGEGASISPYVLTLNIAPAEKVPPRFEDLLRGASKRIKLGSIIGSRVRVPPRTTLEPGSLIEK